VTSPQDVFERYLRGELSLGEAADAISTELLERKAAGQPMKGMSLQKPKGLEITPELTLRAEAFFDEMERRVRG
jgi:hypothetical protein